MTTDFSNKITILAELWMNYREDDHLDDFMEYNDLGLPMAYLLMNEIVLPSEQSVLYIDETFDLLLSALSVEDKGFESLDELLAAADM
jgi:hypothetical protein